MGIIKNTPRYLNLDADDKLVQSEEMSHALNVRISSDDDGNSGVIKNIEGNIDRTSGGLGAGGSIVGVYEHEGTNRMFVFIQGIANTVYELEQGSNTFTLLSSSNKISLSGDPLHIAGMVIDDELYLYFTDGVNEPQKINVDNPDGFYPYCEEELSVLKIQATSPTAVFDTDVSVDVNNIYGRSFQFALQYVWKDRELSAIGEYSDVYVAPNTLDQVVDGDEYRDLNNKIIISYAIQSITGLDDALEGVKVFFKDVADNTLYYIDEYTTAELAAGVDFYNNKTYTPVSDAEYNKLQDAVPKTAQTLDMSNNRLFYGNITEGFDKQTVTATLTPQYQAIPVETNIAVTAPSAAASNVDLDLSTAGALADGSTDIKTHIDFTLGDSVFTDSGSRFISLTINGSFVGQDFSATVAVDLSEYNFKKELVSIAPANAAAYTTDLISQLDGTTFRYPVTTNTTTSTVTIGADVYNVYHRGYVDVTISATDISGDIRLDFDITNYLFEAYKVDGTVSSNDVVANAGYNVTSYTISGWDILAEDSYAQDVINPRTFKSGESHSFGVVFEDNRGRTSGVYEIGSVNISRLSNRVNKGKATVSSTLSVSNANPEFTNFFYVYNGGSTIEDYVQYSVGEVWRGNDNSAGADTLYVSLRTLQGKPQSYVDGEGADIGYSYTQGDRLRVLSYDTVNGRQYPVGIEFEVSGVETIDDPTQIAGVGADFYKTGTFLVLKDAQYTGWDEDKNSSLWFSSPIVEVYSPKKGTTTEVYKAISGKYPIADIGSAQILSEGNAWYKRRSIKFIDGVAVTEDLLNEIHYVESKEYNDKDGSSKGFLGGKPYAVIEGEKEYGRLSTITYSEPMLQDSAYNFLSSFNNSLANFSDYDINYGGIYGIVDNADSLTVLQSDKISRVPVSRQILTTAGGNEFVTQSTDVLGLQQHYPVNAGINEDRTAFLKADETLYIVDVTRSKIVAFGSGGINVLSDLNVSSWVEERCDLMVADPDGYFVSIGYDRPNDEIVFSLQNEPTSGEKSIVYSTNIGRFTSFVEYTSKYYGTLGNRFFQTRDNEVWEGGVNATQNNFFGTQYDSEVEVVFNDGASISKGYNAISIEGDSASDVTITTKSNSVNILEAAFDEREDEWFARVPRAAGNNEYVILGKVSAESDPNVTFYNRINRVNFRMNGDVYEYDGTSFNPLAGVTVDGIVDANTLTMTNAGSVFVNDVLAVKGESIADGDPIKGYYAKTKVTFDDTSAIEIFALNAQVSREKLHNDVNSQQ